MHALMCWQAQACVGTPKRLAGLLANPRSVEKPLTECCEDKHEFSTQGLVKGNAVNNAAAVLCHCVFSLPLLDLPCQ